MKRKVKLSKWYFTSRDEMTETDRQFVANLGWGRAGLIPPEAVIAEAVYIGSNRTSGGIKQTFKIPHADALVQGMLDRLIFEPTRNGRLKLHAQAIDWRERFHDHPWHDPYGHAYAVAEVHPANSETLHRAHSDWDEALAHEAVNSAVSVFLANNYRLKRFGDDLVAHCWMRIWKRMRAGDRPTDPSRPIEHWVRVLVNDLRSHSKRYKRQMACEIPLEWPNYVIDKRSLKESE